MELSLAAALLLLSQLPPTFLAVWTGREWREWWSTERAPTEWAAPDPDLTGALKWRRVADGVEWAEARLAGIGEAHRIRLIVARLDPTRVRFRLDTAYTHRGTRPAWTAARARPEALVAVNAGQFPYSLPWGWVVLEGREYSRPGYGPTSMAVAFDTAGGVRWIPGDSLTPAVRRKGATVAFQSYPALIFAGAVLRELQDTGRGVDLVHRDARAAIGQSVDGRVLIALTRFDGAGGLLDFVPFGLTTPEMAAVMGALGSRNAVMLDGGISSQLLIRDPAGAQSWRGLRSVPLGLMALPR
jgi:hypothetical protein